MEDSCPELIFNAKYSKITHRAPAGASPEIIQIPDLDVQSEINEVLRRSLLWLGTRESR